MNINDFARRKVCGEKLSMVTCYDFWSAQLLDQTDVDTILVGDSLAMVMHSFPSTVHATVDMMATHMSQPRVVVHRANLLSVTCHLCRPL